MSTVSDAVRTAGARPAGGIGQSVRDSLVVAKRNLIRMTRIPNPVRGASLRCDSPGPHGQQVNARNGLVVGPLGRCHIAWKEREK